MVDRADHKVSTATKSFQYKNVPSPVGDEFPVPDGTGEFAGLEQTMNHEPKYTMGTWLALLQFGLTAGTAFGLVLSLMVFPWVTPSWWSVFTMIIVIAAMPAGMAIALYLPIDRITVAAFRTMALWAAVLMGASFGCSMGIAFGAIGAGTGALLGGCISYTEFRRGEKDSAGMPAA